MPTTIHPTAIVDRTAELGDEVQIGPYAIVEGRTRIGAGTIVGPHCTVGAGTILGRNNHLYHSAQIGIVPQDLKHLPGVHGRTEIGDNNTFREFVTVSSSTVYAGDDGSKVTRIGSNGLFMATTHIAHDCVVGDGVIMANGAALAGHVTIEDRVNVGGLAGVHQFCVLGRMSFIGGMSRINKDVPPYMLVEGSPARCHGPNTVGLQRGGLGPEAIATIRRIYKLLYRSDLNTTQALARIEAEIADCPEKQVLVTFIRNSPRGICK